MTDFLTNVGAYAIGCVIGKALYACWRRYRHGYWQ